MLMYFKWSLSVRFGHKIPIQFSSQPYVPQVIISVDILSVKSKKKLHWSQEFYCVSGQEITNEIPSMNTVTL
jgi:hypothetical protein